MAKQRSAFAETGRRGPFAVAYWGFFALWVIATVAALVAGSQFWQTAVGLAGLVGVLILSVVRQVLASRLHDRRDAERRDIPS